VPGLEEMVYVVEHVSPALETPGVEGDPEMTGTESPASIVWEDAVTTNADWGVTDTDAVAD
jgi:hypothetical protein